MSKLTHYLFGFLAGLPLTAALAADPNIAPSGTAYGWSAMTSSGANSGKTARPGLNDNNLSANVDLRPSGDAVNAWEAAGITWPNPVNVSAANFINGTTTADGDGFLEANIKLQFSANGSSWTDSGWTISPAYPYSSAASGKTYAFSGTAANAIKGARVVGQVRVRDGSYHWIVKEVRVFGSSGTGVQYSITTSAGANGAINPGGTVSVNAGASQSFTISPNSGYAIAGVQVDGSSIGTPGNYTFSNVQANHSIAATFDISSLPVAAMPVFAPPGGSYASAQSVTITSATNAAAIRYTTNGTTPTASTGNLYTGPVAVAGTSTLKAIAYASGYANSSVTSASYVISSGSGPFRPYPQALTFAGTIKPSHVSQQQMNDTIRSYYSYWKNAYVRQSNGITPGGGYYVNMRGTGGNGDEITTSEAHGYGMIVFALMAGQDANARQYFDGMYNMYDKHRSTIDSDLMSWLIDRTELSSKDSDSATDGDMDIAYALLLADKQWGSGGSINYLAQARRMINNGLKGSDVSATSHRTLLGDWNIGHSDQTRASDWMSDHMKAYKAATGDTFWDSGVSTIYSLISQLTAGYSPNTGLMPDFVINNPPKPAPPDFLEAPTDGDYSWNSCRYPWRLATDVAHYNSAQSRAAANKMLGWIKGATNNSPGNIRAGYKLNGTALTSDVSAAFTAPFVAAAIVDPAHQAYLNAGWTRISDWREEYYGDSINLLSMLLISGNWWAP